MKRWPALEYLAWPATGILFLGWNDQWLSDETRLGAWGWLSISFVLFFAASAVGARLWLLALNTGAYFVGTYDLLDHPYHRSMGAFALTLALLHGGLALAVREKRKELGQFAAAMGGVLLTLAIPIQFVGFRITMLWSLEAAALTWIARADRSARLRWRLAVVRIGLRQACYLDSRNLCDRRVDATGVF